MLGHPMRGGTVMPTSVVQYRLDDGTVVRFEVEPPAGFRPAGPDEIAGRIREAVTPAVEGAKAVLEQVREARPDSVELKFGIKVSGTANWLIAKAATEANFEVTLTWEPEPKAATKVGQ
jgi:Trypsin-co-occurring domain 1